MFLPQRTITHIHDTKAVRLVLEKIPDSWLVRNMEERDYGIDLLLELFEEIHEGVQKPTGQMLLFQIKGIDDSWDSSKKENTFYQFPSKTLEYAKLFNIPFFVVEATLKDSQVHFMHLQKYAKIKIINSSEEKINITIPTENDLDKNQGKDKIKDIACVYAKEHDLYLIQQKYFNVKTHFETKEWYDKKSLLNEIKDLLHSLLKEQYVKSADDFNNFCEEEDREPYWPDFHGIQEITELEPKELKNEDWNLLKLFIKYIPSIIWINDGFETEGWSTKYEFPY